MEHKVTIIGSSPDLFELLKNKLSEIGFYVSFCDLNDAPNFKRDHLPNLILLDFILPLQRYINFLKGMAQIESPYPVVVYGLCDQHTLDENKSLLEQFQEIYPVSKIFIKPFKTMDLIDSVNQEFHPEGKSLKVILVIDDSPTQLAVTIKLLSQKYNVITASTGKEGLRLAMSESPDLILLDLNMPDTNGLKVCADLKSFHPTDKTPIAIYSDNLDQHHISRSMLVGASAYIPKNTSEKELIKKIDHFLKSNYIIMKKE